MAKILIVDDEPGIRDLLERLLRKEGHVVLLAEGGGTALELFCESQPDVIVLDLKMPGIEGLTVLKQIQRLKPGQRVIVLTGVGAPDTEAQVRALGAIDYLEKDTSLCWVGETIKQVLDTVPSSRG